MLKRFNMADAKEKKTPMDTKCHLQLNPKGIDVDQKLYTSGKRLIDRFFISGAYFSICPTSIY